MNILHISDMHIGMEIVEDENKLGEEIDEVLDVLGEKYYPDILLVTGDFTNTGSAIEFNNAKTILEDFQNYDTLKNIKSCVLVPGNHDYQWEENGQSLNDTQKAINYINFIQGFPIKGCTVSDNNLQKSLNKYMIQHSFQNIVEISKGVLLIGMNSMRIDSRERAGQGYFSKEQLKIIKRLINYYKKKVKELVVLAAFHHHIVPVSVLERETLRNAEKFSLTLDARRAINSFLENNIRFALHGHQHQPSVITWTDNVKYKDKQLTIVSAGSISAPRNVIGDISKNSFMLYSIDDTQLVINHFCSSNEDADLFRKDSDFECRFELWESELEKVKCNIKENGIKPKGLEMQKYIAGQDTSNLYYLYLNVNDCYRSCIAIDKFTQEYNKNSKQKVTICGLHHLYGKYDILIKYRHDEASDIYKKRLEEYLRDSNEMLKSANGYFLNVSYEKLYCEDRNYIPVLKNAEDYLNSTWNMATLKVDTGKKLSPTAFLEKLQKKIEIFDYENNTKIEDIIRNYVIGQDQNILFELFISCYQFPMLTRFTNIIEDIVKDFGVDKSTHIIYYYDEREV